MSISVEVLVLSLRVLVLCSHEVAVQHARTHGIGEALTMMLQSVEILFRLGRPSGRLLVLLLQTIEHFSLWLRYVGLRGVVLR